MKVFYVSDENYNVPKQVGTYEDLSFLAGAELDDFMDKIDALYLTEEEREKLTLKLEAQIETNLKNLNQEMRDAYSISAVSYTHLDVYKRQSIIGDCLPIPVAA